MLDNYFDKEFEIRYFEINQFNVASPSTILTLLEETAADHCESINQSLPLLEKQNIGWVLMSGYIQMERYPYYKEKIRIRTWLSKYSLFKGFRENIIYDEKGNIIGRSKGMWVFFDIEKRKPTQIFDEIIEKWSFCEQECADYNISKKILTINTSDFDFKLKVNRFDTDTNKHVNNIRYLHWVVESMPDEIIDNYDLHSIDGRFVAEAHYGQELISLTKENTNLNSEELSFSHTVKIEDTTTVCAVAQTIWRKRKTILTENE